MLALRRDLTSSASRTRTIVQRARRRFASTEHGEPAHHSHHASGPKEEPIGRGFFIGLGLIPLSLLVYQLSQPSESGEHHALTKLIQSYSNYHDRWTERNALHTRMAEQAAFDRHLFQGSPGGKTVELRFPEIFNTGAPWNVVAGSQANLDELIAHYQKQNRDEEARKQAVLAAKERGK
ncbi:hypothetical protein GP486_002558 [Trichoglossum hirsutum]|uniref:NADH-ubiquinone oxidoreductase 17.8 kDa subunit n=1 Tax=Trichoglossum hirsutum TaxID=265104 RepID=A0A9P8RS03_9PEZI|nr:hypothetical protein GP486_002558 [Trichoglossum hirsutum]